MLTVLRAFLSTLPGEVEKEVNLVRLAEIVVECELPGGTGIADAIKQVIAEADTLFPDAVTRGLYVRSLTLLLNILAHHAPVAA